LKYVLDSTLATSYEYDKYYIDGDVYNYTYSLGDVNISSKFNTPIGNMSWYRKYDIHLKQGWNVIRYGKYFDNTLQDEVDRRISEMPTANAVWVLLTINN